MVEDECVVCYEMTTDRVVPCNHTICASCARSWFTRRVVCPLCLQLPCKLVTSDGGDETDVFFDRPPIGVTVTTRSNEVIVKAVQRSAFKKGIRVGDIVRHVNDIPVTRHTDVISIVQNCEKHNLSIKLGMNLTAKPWFTYRKVIKALQILPC